jgi:dUTP pyrophosphatase
MGVVKFTKLHADAKMPSRSPGDVGYDLASTMVTVIKARTRALIPTGIALLMPRYQGEDENTEHQMYGRIASRSGLAWKNGLDVGAGVIDPAYTGELKVVIFNNSDEDFNVNVGDRIAQLIFELCETPQMEEVAELAEETARGANGFGSSGV